MAGTITLTVDGGTALTPLSLSIEAGALILSGQTVDTALEGDLSLAIDAGALAIAGQTVEVGVSGDESYLYVNASTGDDSRTKAQAASASTPWLTIHRAVKGSATAGSTNASEAVAAGEVVLVSPGTYSEVGTGTGRFNVILSPVNEGTSGNPIIIRGNGGRPEIRAANATFRGPMIGSDSKDYVIWDGFTINDYYCASQSDTGPVVMYNCTRSEVINCDIAGHTGTYYWGHATWDGSDNYKAIGLEDTTYCAVRNNNVSRMPGGQNSCGVQTYDTAYLTVEQNTFTDCSNGVFIKGWHDSDGSPQPNGIIIRRNLVEAPTYGGIRVLTAFDTQVYQNIIANADGDTGCLFSGFSNCENTVWQNNVIYGGSRGMMILNSAAELVNVRYLNNIVMNAVDAIYSYPVESPNGEEVWWERNLYYGNTRVYQTEGSTNATTLAQWQALSATQCDPNGSNSNPTFVNAAAGDFHLDTGSPALTLGRDVLNISGLGVNATIPAGAYITGSEQIGADW